MLDTPGRGLIMLIVVLELFVTIEGFRARDTFHTNKNTARVSRIILTANDSDSNTVPMSFGCFVNLASPPSLHSRANLATRPEIVASLLLSS